MPASTEQVLHPERYAKRDVPVSLTFSSAPEVLYEDVLGESEIRVLMARLTGANEVRVATPVGWGGDRYRVYRSAAGPALVWYMVWDEQRSADAFMKRYAEQLRSTTRRGYRAAVEGIELEGRPATRYVLAPADWNGWTNLPRPSITQ
jgi:hypothetical protein